MTTTPRTRVATASAAMTVLLGLALWPVTTASAATPSYVDESSIDAVATAVAANRDTFGGVSLDAKAATLTVRYADEAGLASAATALKSFTAPWRGPTTAPAATARNMSSTRGLARPNAKPNPATGRQVKLVLVEVDHSLAELDVVRSQLAKDPAWKQVVAEEYVDVATNRVSVGVTQLTSGLADLARRSFGDLVTLHTAVRPDRTSRTDDFEPWTVGIRIWSAAGGCSTGFVIRNLTTGVKRMVTAGHCGPVGTAWNNNGDAVGTTVSRNFVDGGLDVSYIGGRTYEPWAYVGGPTSNIGQWITGTYLSLVGRQYCSDGATSGEVCTGTVSAIDACITFSDGVRTCFLDVLSGGTFSTFGDSGGPIISTAALDPNSVKIGGIIIGGGNPTYFHSYHYLVPAGWTFDNV
jgi:hypothetical protein